MDDGRIHLVYGSDDNYVFPTLVSAASAAKCLGADRRLTIHLFDAGVSDDHWDEFVQKVQNINSEVACQRHILKEEMFSGFGAWKGSVVTYSRMFIAELLPELDWAIYFDGDTLWTGDIGKLWDLRDCSKTIIASIDPPTPNGSVNPEWEWYEKRGIEMDPNHYFCMGLMLANLKKMREDNVAGRCRDFMQKYPAPRVVDQTALNCVCKGSVVGLPPEWGVFSAWHGNADLTRDGAIHYVSDVPWKRDKINKLLSDVVMLWFDFCKRVLNYDCLPMYVGKFGRWWRRRVFLLFKNNQWLLKVHPFLASRFRNTHGLSVSEELAIRKRFFCDKDLAKSCSVLG